jgi:hypothetical protein
MTEQLIRDIAADKERLRDRIEDINRIGRLESRIAVLDTIIAQTVSKGLLSDEQNKQLELVRKERERAMADLKSEMRIAFGEAIRTELKNYSDDQAKVIRLYTRIGMLVLVALVAKEAGLLNMARTFIGL